MITIGLDYDNCSEYSKYYYRMKDIYLISSE